MSIDLRQHFCHSKRVFSRYRLVVVSEKNVVDENYDENYSSMKLTLPHRPHWFIIFLHEFEFKRSWTPQEVELELKFEWRNKELRELHLTKYK